MGRKKYWQGDVNDNFVPGELLVVMDQALSGYNKVHSPEFFVGVEVIKVIDIAPPKSPEKVKPGFNQYLKLILSEKYNTKEATLEAMHILEPIVGIRSVEPNGILELLLAPNDPYYSFADGVSDQWAIDNIKVPLVWDFTTGSKSVKIGVVDTGIASHYDLNDNYNIADAWTFYDSDDLSCTQYLKTDSNYHGTHVAGIIGAVGNDGVGITGINWDVSLVQMRTVGTTRFDATVKAIRYAMDTLEDEEKISILNFSAGTKKDSDILEDAVRDYCDAGGLLVCATWNDDVDNGNVKCYPGYYGTDAYGNNGNNIIPNIITVSQIDIHKNRPAEASWGNDTVMIYAPGELILSTFPESICIEKKYSVSISGNSWLECECDYDEDTGVWIPTSIHRTNGYHYMVGSSMSTPHVSGVAALLLSVNPNLTAAQIKSCIMNGAENSPITIGDGTTQEVKKLNAWGAFQYLMTTYPYDSHNVGYSSALQYTYNVDADASYMKDHTAMSKLVIDNQGEYDFNITSEHEMNVVLYNSELTQLKNTMCDEMGEISHYMYPGVYYLKINYTDSNAEGVITVDIDCPSHSHSYTEYIYYSDTEHIGECACSHTITEEHNTMMQAVSGNQHAEECWDCGYIDESTREAHSFDGWVFINETTHMSRCECGAMGITTAPHGFVPLIGSIDRKVCAGCGYTKTFGSDGGFIIMSNTKMSVNGSYILPDGNIVLVDEDVEAYLNGTLVFYDKDELPEMQ